MSCVKCLVSCVRCQGEKIGTRGNSRNSGELKKVCSWTEGITDSEEGGITGGGWREMSDFVRFFEKFLDILVYVKLMERERGSLLT